MDPSTAATCWLSPPTSEARAKVRLLREFDPAAKAAGDLDVPDPYYGGARASRGAGHGRRAARGLLDELRAAGRV